MRAITHSSTYADGISEKEPEPVNRMIQLTENKQKEVLFILVDCLLPPISVAGKLSNAAIVIESTHRKQNVDYLVHIT